MVVPLALTYHGGKRFRSLRSELRSLRASVRIASFDRAPDSLFGDDVKTRAAVVSIDRRSPKRLFTTGLLRWSSANRETFLGSVTFAESDWAHADLGIPKVGSEVELSALRALGPHRGHFGRCFEVLSADGNGASPSEVLVGATGYNWLPVFRELAAAERVRARSGLRALRFESEDLAEAAFGVLSSCIAYWWWRMYGDGFHVTNRWLQSLPIDLRALPRPDLDELATSGRRLWAAVKDRHTVSVNRGRASISIDPGTAADLRYAVDAHLEKVLGLQPGFAKFAHDHVVEIIEAGRPRRKE
jgi:hypothetical protein